ncbi:oligopeptide/dipeptide ABC transporter ATP-binding protein [Salirhabdus euzebyi]|uniref:Oligopeptide/dipeptide ABC transporter ATP-binding protein n=1 Tax=Salirhabdus euzebyi TaxID=394506 RepID=A0A841Q5S4_9BACI|nr:ABC transporter ATP-binding protein [Salirhabdus euzebyi]MBB6453748.1 oligopeptide/dipeptide ABC transporter ATP-binding protein [Salirhabdus euzebyi]
MKELLQVKNLSVEFQSDAGKIRAIDDVSFNVKPGETVCIVGESGSGKSVTSLSVMRLLEYENGSIAGGEVLFENEDLVTKSQEEMRKIRGNDISIIFQEPMTALNPVFTIGRQLIEGIQQHQDVSKKEAWDRACELLRLVGLNDVPVRMKQYPHELSGGMRQRVMIAIALAGNPKLLIADEPTTALDVTIETQILNLLNELKEKINMSIILITHDMGVAAEVADKIVVMYAGKIVEQGTVYQIFDEPTHPYTKGLLQSIPSDTDKKDRLYSIKGTIPSLNDLPQGCRFHPRCEFATDKCLQSEPPLLQENDREVACWNFKEVLKEKVKL